MWVCSWSCWDAILTEILGKINETGELKATFYESNRMTSDPTTEIESVIAMKWVIWVMSSNLWIFNQYCLNGI